MNPGILSIDIGGTSIKTAVIDEAGHPRLLKGLPGQGAIVLKVGADHGDLPVSHALLPRQASDLPRRPGQL